MEDLMNVEGETAMVLIGEINCFTVTNKSRDISVGVETGSVLDGRGSIPGRGFFIFLLASTPTLRPTHPPMQWVPCVESPEVKWQGRETDHLPSSSAEVKNRGAIPPLPDVILIRQS
jgi:hypothetical protein